MSRRRLPKPRWHRYAAAAAGVIVVAGGAAFAGAVTSGGGNGSAAGSRAAVTGGATASPGAVAPVDATPGATAAPSGTASATPTGTTTTATTAAPKGRAKAPVAVVTSAPAAARKAVPLPAAGPAVFSGLAFDTCTAPGASTMSAWRAHSPYAGAAVYIGGRNRGCAQPQLTASWARTVSAAGWKLIPLYVGAQPPCQTSGNPERLTAATAASLGASDGADAVARARALGMRAGSALYLDMEAYDTSDSSCVAAVLTYIQAWDRAAHARGYWAGFYGFTSSSAAAVAKAKGSMPDLPDALWYAKYDGNADTTTAFTSLPFASNLWTGHRRGHQYLVNRKETYGGVSLTVDRDAWDAPVAVVG